jgi:thymidylate synthase
MEEAYLNLVREVIEHGDYRVDRTKVGTYSLFAKQLVFSLNGEILPLLTTKKVMVKSILKELLWIMKGQTDSEILNENGVKIWNDNGSKDFLNSLGFTNREKGDLGPIYGFQWRHAGVAYIDSKTDYNYQGIDQLKQLVETLKQNPTDRRMIICSWNVPQLQEMALPPCHCLVQFYVRGKKYLDCQLYQRSADLGLGVPFNIASYSFLMYVLGKWCNLIPGNFTHTFGDVHVYSNHVEALKIQLSRQPYLFPNVEFTGNFTLEKLNEVTMDEWCDSFIIKNYRHHPAIKMDMAV